MDINLDAPDSLSACGLIRCPLLTLVSVATTMICRIYKERIAEEYKKCNESSFLFFLIFSPHVAITRIDRCSRVLGKQMSLKTIIYPSLFVVVEVCVKYIYIYGKNVRCKKCHS